MTERQVLIIGVRIAAVWVFVFLVTQMPQWFLMFQPLEEMLSEESFTFWANPWTHTLLFYAILLLSSAVLWFKPELILPRKPEVKEPSIQSDSGQRDFSDLHFTLISTLGLYFLVIGLMSIIFQVIQTADTLLRADGLSVGWGLHFYWNWAALIIKTGVGLALMVKAQTIVRLLRSARNL